jgi:hypothetical protein
MSVERDESGLRWAAVKQERWSLAVSITLLVAAFFMLVGMIARAILSSRALIALALVTCLTGCTSAPTLAADEAKAAAVLTTVHAAISSGAALTDVQALSAAALAADPTSPVLVKVNAVAASAKTAQDLADLDAGVQGGIAVLKLATVAPVSGQ